MKNKDRRETYLVSFDNGVEIRFSRERKTFPIRAGMAQARIKTVGYKVMEFTWNEHDQLISETEIKRVIYPH